MSTVRSCYLRITTTHFTKSVDTLSLFPEEVYTPSAMWQTALRREAEKTQQLEEKYVNKLKCHNVSDA